MNNFKEYQIIIPKIKGNLKDPIENASTEDEKLAYITLEKIYSVIKGMKNTNATLEKLGWYSIWCQLEKLQREMITITENNLEFCNNIIQRRLLELNGITDIILSPLDKEEYDKSKWSKILQRFRAYCVWCFWNELGEYKRVLYKKNLYQIFEVHPAQKYIKNLELNEKIFNYIQNPELDQEKLNIDRQNFEKKILNIIEQFEFWFNQNEFKIMVNKIKRNYRSKDDYYKYSIPFFRIFNIKGLKHHFTIEETDFIYLQYSNFSSQIHNSIITDVIRREDKAQLFYPSISKQNIVDVKTTFDFVVSILVKLEITKSHIWT